MRLTEQQKSFLADNGYLILRDIVPDSVSKPIVSEYERRLDALVDDWISAGKLEPGAAEGSFREKIMSAYEARLDFFQPLDISLPAANIEADTPMHAGPAVFDLLVCEPILDAVESLIGPELVSNPIQHVRIKPPSRIVTDDDHRAHVSTTAWHQDRGVAQEQADRTEMITVWVAVTDATEANGCLQCLPGTHKGALMDHCPQPQTGIPERTIDVGSAIPLEVPAGGAVLFHPLTVHGAGANRTEEIRWSFDLRYNVTGQPTGREIFPDFVARSRAHPETEMHDAGEWARMWAQTKERLTGEGDLHLHRWSQEAPICA